MISKSAAFALVFFLSACDENKPAPSDAPPPGPSALIAPKPPPPTQAPTIGVPECDEYFKAAFRCTSLLAPELRAKAENAIMVNVAGWTALAQTPANRADLVQQCSKVLERVKASPNCR